MRTLICFSDVRAGLSGAGLKAGTAKVDITPTGPIWMSGYAARTHPSEGVASHLWAKALAIESSPSARIVIVTVDVVGIPREVSDAVAARVGYNMKRSQFLINASHTHTGPIVWPNLRNLTVLPPGEQEKLESYARNLHRRVGQRDRSGGQGSSPGHDRLWRGLRGICHQPPSGGPSERSRLITRYPVLRITDPSGKVRAILFGYACHNTTLTGEVYQISGDYAGFAAAALEERHPGATALFMELCGADQNPSPREHHRAGQTARGLAGRRGGTGPRREVDARQRPRSARPSGWRPCDSPRGLARILKPSRNSKVPAQARRGEMMLQALDAGKKVDQIEYPVQAVRFGRSLTLVALGGEVVVDYALRIKREYTGEPHHRRRLFERCDVLHPVASGCSTKAATKRSTACSIMRSPARLQTMWKRGSSRRSARQ